MKNPFPILIRIIKAPWITLKLDSFYYEVCTKPHPKLKVIPNKKYLVALMKGLDQYPTDYKRETYEIRKSIRNGNNYNKFHIENHINEIIKINLSNSQRQGKDLPEYMANKMKYAKKFSDTLLHGIFKDGKLIAYADIVKYGDVNIIGPFIGHSDYLKEGIMYHLFDRLIIDCSRMIMYDTFLGNTEGLTYFKKKLGFKEYNVRWTK
jgi:hypothetical protein